MTQQVYYFPVQYTTGRDVRIRPMPVNLSLANPVLVARQLLGAELITRIGGVETGVYLTETEAYFAPDDRASHAHDNKRTRRTEVFYQRAGTAYVYLCYGIHEMMNVVTGPEGTPHAVLIRAGEPSRGLDDLLARRGMTKPGPKLSTGPGVLTKALGIDRRFNGRDLLAKDGPLRLRVRDDSLLDSEIIATPRVGIDYAGEPWVSKPWRFCKRGSVYVSRRDLIKDV